MDADIEPRPGILVKIRELMKKRDIPFVSLMASLRMKSFWEKLLMPAFIFFFKLLYPFRLSNSRPSRVAAAAGGFILTEARLFDEMAGFKSIKGALIDDCALARAVKSRGHRTWIGLTHGVNSLRRYDNLEKIWNMVARNAFTQLRYSLGLLLLCTAMLLVAFCVPVVVICLGDPVSRSLSTLALGMMVLSYVPTLRFYRLSPWWALGLPLSGLLFMGMTWTSAIGYWQGRRSQWKGRIYR
jgi:hopene-associated glycosyltransferase HpnB